MSHCWAVIRNSNRPLAVVRVVLRCITMVLKSSKRNKKPVLVYNHGSRICETKWKTLHHTGVNQFLTKCKWAMQNISHANYVYPITKEDKVTCLVCIRIASQCSLNFRRVKESWRWPKIICSFLLRTSNPSLIVAIHGKMSKISLKVGGS
jgi:hypothetical protein